MERALAGNSTKIICPLRFTLAAFQGVRGLEGRLDPGAAPAGPKLYETLGAPSSCCSRGHRRSVFTRLATRGAPCTPSTSRPTAGALADLMGAVDGPRTRSSTGTRSIAPATRRPRLARVWRAARAALDAIAERLDDLRDVTVLLTADHGQVAVSPERVDYLDGSGRAALDALVSRGPPGPHGCLPARSRGARRDGDGAAAARLGEGARVLPAAELFERIGPRLAARLGHVAILAAPGARRGCGRPRRRGVVPGSTAAWSPPRSRPTGRGAARLDSGPQGDAVDNRRGNRAGAPPRAGPPAAPVARIPGGRHN